MFQNADGTNRIIAAGEKFLVPNSNCFQKDLYDVSNYKVKSRSHTKNEPIVSYKDFDGYMLKREWINRWVLGKKQKNN